MSVDPVAVVQSRAHSLYRSLTFITTYQCTAACKDCCFESSPTLDSGRLSHDFMRGVIDEARLAMPNLRVVVFSGGECFMLKEELFRTIEYAAGLGLHTRCVTNGYWGKTAASAARIAGRLRRAGLSEINISTGLDHQKWVPLSSVVNDVQALTDQGIFTLVTVEKDSAESSCWHVAREQPLFQRLQKERPRKFKLQSNSWMPFHADSEVRPQQLGYGAEKSCEQLFSNLVITPYKMVSACCGLTYEHIPEMRLGAVGSRPLAAFVDDIASDFLKIWIHMDGPKEVVRKITGRPDIPSMDGAVHICQACAILHRNAEFRQLLKERYHEFLPEVVGRFLLRKAMAEAAREAARDAGTPSRPSGRAPVAVMAG